MKETKAAERRPMEPAEPAKLAESAGPVERTGRGFLPDEAPKRQTAGADAPAENVPAWETPGADVPTEDTPARETLANGTPVYITKSHRFGQDALLLAHFCGVRSRESACDLGCGCGIIALRWHDRGHRGPCLAVELSPEAAALARKAAEEAGAEHITVQNCDLRDAGALRPYAQTCSLAACNPP